MRIWNVSGGLPEGIVASNLGRESGKSQHLVIFFQRPRHILLFSHMGTNNSHVRIRAGNCGLSLMGRALADNAHTACT